MSSSWNSPPSLPFYPRRCLASAERKADLVNPAVQAEKAETTSFLLSAFGRLTADVDGGSVFWSNVLVGRLLAPCPFSPLPPPLSLTCAGTNTARFPRDRR